MHFNGPDYNPLLDKERLSKQIGRIFTFMKDQEWKTLSEIAISTNDPEASISAQLRHLRKKRFGNHTVNKIRRGNPKQGLFEYQLIVNKI